MSNSKYQAVIFDLDGVITDTARYHYLAWKALANSLGLDFDEEFNEQLKGVDRMGSLELILAQGSQRYSDEQKLVMADQKNDHYRQLISTMTAKDVLPGAIEALSATRNAGLKVGLASVSKNAAAILERLGISDRFDYVVDANLIRRGKPDPEIFLNAASYFNIAPAACIGVEDSVAGLKSIKSAGMYAVGVGAPDVLSEADVVIPNLEVFDLNSYLNQR